MLLAGLLSACVTVPQPLRGAYSAVTPQQVREQNQGSPQRVRWGGEIISTQPDARQTCFEVLGRPLDDTSARPLAGDATQGRFIACATGFYEPGVYTKGREITVTGTLGETTTRKVGDFDYRYPHVIADTVYLWPKLINYPAYPGYYNDPFYDSFYPFYDPFYYPFPRFRHFRH